jgi:hypothetical protein
METSIRVYMLWLGRLFCEEKYKVRCRSLFRRSGVLVIGAEATSKEHGSPSSADGVQGVLLTTNLGWPRRAWPWSQELIPSRPPKTWQTFYSENFGSLIHGG